MRRGVAGNPSTPSEILKEFAKDKDEDVRWGSSYESECHGRGKDDIASLLI